MKLLYISSSSYSGSTLLSFLLNTHPDIFTAGEMDGWNYPEEETFECSCGKILSACPFFRLIADTFQKNQLPFDFRDFGTKYSLATGERLNRYLTKGLPRIITGTPLERWRDAVMHRVPSFSARLAQQARANLTFIRAALSYSGASVFVDACKCPYRLRHLRLIKDLDISIIYLIRDPRGVVLSYLDMKWPGWDASVAIRHWIHEQFTIVRILSEFSSVRQVYYEDLCQTVDESLESLHRFMGLTPHAFPGDFKSVEHHILGNSMRVSNVSKIVPSTRWKQVLSASELHTISRSAINFVENHEDHPLSEIIRHYLQ